MDRLPPEILDVCLSLCNPNDIANFRLSCQRSAKIGERHLFRNLHVMYHPKSFDNLRQISLHPTFSRYVASIFYEFQVLVELDEDEYIMNLQDNDLAGGWEDNHEDTLLRLGRGWAAYKELFEKQMYLTKTNQCACILTQCLMRFPMLKSLELSAEIQMSPDQLDPTDELQRMFQATYAVPGDMLHGGDDSGDEGVGVRALTTLIAASSGMQKKLESLKIRCLDWAFFTVSPRGMNFYRPSFIYLRHLSMKFEAGSEHMVFDEVIKSRHAEFGVALRTATRLRSLSLAFADSGVAPDYILTQRRFHVPVMWDKLVKNMTWKNLRSLELHVATVSETTILDFLKRHNKTLKILRWHNMWLTKSDNGWNKVFKAMRETMKFNLLQFYGTWGGGGKEDKHKFINMNISGEKITKSILRGPVQKSQRVQRDRVQPGRRVTRSASMSMPKDDHLK